MHPVLAQALNELRLGRKLQAQALLARLVQQEPQLADAWVALAACLDAPERQRYCLERALSLAPAHPQARRAWEALTGTIWAPPPSEKSAVEEAEAPLPQAVQEIEYPDQTAASADQSEWFTTESAESPSADSYVEAEEALTGTVDRTTIPLGAAEFDLEQFQAEWQAESAPTPSAPTGAEQVAQWLQELPPVEGIPRAAPEPTVAETAPAVTVPQEPAGKKPSRATRQVTAPEAPEPRGIPWYQVWLMAIFSPSESTYQKLVADPKAKPFRGYLWVYLTSLISLTVNILLLTVAPPTDFSLLQAQSPLPFDLQAMWGNILIGLLAASPVLALFSVLGVMLTAALYQLIARLMIGEGTFRELVYVLSAIGAPLSLISLVFSLPVPYLNLLGIVVGLYSFFLTLLAVKAINRFGWGSSCATVAAIPILAAICGCLVSILLIPQSAPIDLFQPIITPVP